MEKVQISWVGGNNLPVKLLTYTSLLYVQIRSASNPESEYFKLLYHLYFSIILSYGLSQKHLILPPVFVQAAVIRSW